MHSGSAGSLSDLRSRWQLERFAEPLCIELLIMNLAPSGPLYGSDADDPPYFSEEWWTIFRGVCEDARALDMRLWFYDQFGFSGANMQARLVTPHPTFAGQSLEHIACDVEGAGVLECPEAGTPIAASVIPIDGQGQPVGEPIPVPVHGKRVTWHGSGTHRLILFYSRESGFDYFNFSACQTLLTMVHGAFEEHVGDFFGNVIVGTFQDELAAMPTWSRDFAEAFRARCGYDVLPVDARPGVGNLSGRNAPGYRTKDRKCQYMQSMIYCAHYLKDRSHRSEMLIILVNRGNQYVNPVSSLTSHQSVLTALQAVHGITLLHNVLEDSAGQAALDLLQLLVTPEPDVVSTAIAYSHAFRELATAVNIDTTPILSDAWQAYLVARLIDDNNLWSSLVERAGASSVSSSLRAQAQRDLRALHLLFQLDAQMLWKLTCDIVVPVLPILSDAWAPWYDLVPLDEGEIRNARNDLAYQAAESTDWSTLVEPLEAYWSRHGTGPLARYRVLRWQGIEEGLHGIAHPDPIQLNNLIGYEREQSLLKSNTERFLAGLPAHDVLLYGAPGTGKSSTVKALVNTYADRGLRLVEVRKEYSSDLPKIAAQLRGRAPRFLLFIDDLSFEEHETEYKMLKMLLEGTAEARPANVLIYATTNRINLIRENFSERGKPSEDVNWRDSMDEKQSLAHRFGLRVTFSTPDQQRYLKIVTGLAQQRGLTLPEETLQERALRWERQHVGRSGRLARQFIDDLEAELKRTDA